MSAALKAAPQSKRWLAEFFAIAFLFSWTLHLALLLWKVPLKSALGTLLYFLGLGGPMVAALVTATRSSGWTGLREMLAGVIRWRLGWWWLLAILPVGLVRLLSITLYWGIGREPTGSWFGLPHGGIFLMVLGQAGLMFCEELGWRGFAQPRLQAAFGSLGGALILSVSWGIWHLPMFFVPDSNQFGASFIRFWIMVLAWSGCMSLLYNRTGQSTLSAMVFHGMGNIFGFTTLVPPGAHDILSGLYILLSIVVTPGLPAPLFRRQKPGAAGSLTRRLLRCGEPYHK